ncbi:digestive organ expansion factor-like protein, partial [Plakobranchus ocellatus]
MAPKRRRGFGGKNNGRQKRKKFNLITLRQKQDLRQFGDFHPVDSSDNVKSYTKVAEESLGEPDPMADSASSSEESDSEMPAIKELMAEIGMKQEQPESEQESEDESGEEENGAIEEESDDDTDGESDDDDAGESDNSEMEKNHENGNVHALAKGTHTELRNKDNNDSSSDDESGDSTTDKIGGKSGTHHQESKSLKKREISSEAHNRDDATLDSEEDEEDDNDIVLKESDPFTKHFEHERDMTDLFENSKLKWSKQQMKIPRLGESILMYKYGDELAEPEICTDLDKQHVKKKICSHAAKTNSELAKVTLKQGDVLTPFQQRLFRIVNAYQDLLYPKQTHTNSEEIRLVYCMHALNHVLKTRARIIAHNFKIKQNKNHAADDDVEYRDQGLTRPKILIVLPYRDRALKVVNMLISLLFGSEKANVSNRKRFESEFSELEASGLAEKAYKPEDFKKLFEGNTDDNFRLGLSVSKKCLRLYSPFYESDIILASPLGLRMIIGLEGDKERDFDFLSSIEVMIADQVDVFLMQNWDHFLHTCKHLHMQPRESHGVDFSRVRMWSINGWSKHFRQTLIFSSVLLPEILTVFNKHCH